MAFVLALGAFLSTSAGGLFAIRHRSRLHLVLGFSAGVIVGVVAFDLLPEIVRLSSATATDFLIPMVTLVAGFLAFHILEKTILIHTAHENEYAPHRHSRGVGIASALALAGHSLADGVAIGLAVQLDHGVGFAVAIAVIAHDFADGINTASLMLAHGNPVRKALAFLAIDAVAPLLGVALALFLHVSDRDLLLYLAVFAGFLLYIGASDILPEAHPNHSSIATILLTALGAVLIFTVSAIIA